MKDKNSFQDLPLMFVEWVDSMSVNGEWQSVEEIEEPELAIAYSVGWVIGDFPNYLVVAPHVVADLKDIELQACGVMNIPKVCIRRTERLSDPAKRRGSLEAKTGTELATVS